MYAEKQVLYIVHTFNKADCSQVVSWTKIFVHVIKAQAQFDFGSMPSPLVSYAVLWPTSFL